ncbi:MAG: class I SAM-dependent methyltransferase [Planctomycetaceae bacterium]|nr:class I SAM-dependent methyltransferase [Planctomycetaceae bacterium]
MAEPTLLQRNCPLCGRNNQDTARSRWSRNEWTIRDCEQCNLVYLENAVDYEALVEDMSWTATVPLERERRQRAEPIVSRFTSAWKRFRRRFLYRHKCLRLAERYFESGPVLDVGCGGGKFLSWMDERFQPFGIEIDAFAAEATERLLAARCGQVIQADALSGLAQLPEGFFTGILMQCYLEHETAPGEVLKAAARTLRPGGRLIIKVPNFDCWNRHVRDKKWCGFRFPDHVNYFTPDTLSALVRTSGLEVFRCSWLDQFALSDNMYLIATRTAGATNVDISTSAPPPRRAA